MSEPSSWAIEDDSPVRRTSASRCGRATSHRPRELTYAVPRPITFGVSSNPPPTERTYPISCRVSSSRRAVGRASPVAVATSVSDIRRWPASKLDKMSSPRAKASTKSGPSPRPATDLRSAFSNRAGLAEHRTPGTVGGRGLVIGVLVRVVEHLAAVLRQLRVHPLQPDLLAHAGPQVVDGGVDLGPHAVGVIPDELVVRLHHLAVDEHGVHVAALGL